MSNNESMFESFHDSFKGEKWEKEYGKVLMGFENIWWFHGGSVNSLLPCYA